MLHALLLTALMGASNQVQTPDAQAYVAQPVVHGVLFYSPACPHCERLITGHLIPLQDRYGDRLAILWLDTSTDFGEALFRAAMDRYAIPRREWGVPFMIVGDEIMTGSVDIPRRLPGLLEAGLAKDGIDLPDFPALISFLDARGLLLTVEPGPRFLYRNPATRVAKASDPEPPADTVAPGAAVVVAEGVIEDPALAVNAPFPSPSLPAPLLEPPVDVADAAADTAMAMDTGAVDVVPPETETRATAEVGHGPDSAGAPRDEAATGPQAASSSAPSIPLELTAVPNPAATTPWTRFRRDRVGNSTALIVLVGMILALVRAVRLRGNRGAVWPEWVTPVLVVVGLGVALYLSYVEVTGSPATCGPVGDCNTVQQSPYATVFGVLPVGVLGLAGYVSILALWLARNVATVRSRRAAAMGLWALTLMGTLFSAYLTFLEPFVIGATCIWCLTSAVVMALLLLASVGPASRALEAREV